MQETVPFSERFNRDFKDIDVDKSTRARLVRAGREPPAGRGQAQFEAPEEPQIPGVYLVDERVFLGVKS
eukprot:6578826-Prymnesium_polylepis.1